jgi:hypothetical protein
MMIKLSKNVGYVSMAESDQGLNCSCTLSLGTQAASPHNYVVLKRCSLTAWS